MPKVDRTPTSTQELREKELATLKENVEKVRRLLKNKNAEDLIPMLIDDKELNLITDLPNSLDGRK